jgi:2-polyprenyl-3-methyl-5-hydroxy-6-metoxy-1,4-benzoquinol methylase
MCEIDTVRKYYNQNPEAEWNRLGGRKPEFEITMRHLRANLKPESRILDVGGGPGRYSFALAALSHRVTLFDLSEENIGFAKRKAAELNLPLEGYICGNAAALDKYISGRFDADMPAASPIPCASIMPQLIALSGKASAKGPVPIE